MIRKINIRVSAANPQMPLGPFYVFTGSAASFTICDIPLPLGVRKVQGVTVRAKNVGGEVRGFAAVRVGSAWGATVPVGFFSASGSVGRGIVIEASGSDDNGQNVEPWIIGAGDLHVMLMDGSIEPGETTHEMYWHDVKPENPAAGDVCFFEGSVHYFNGTEWISFAGDFTGMLPVKSTPKYLHEISFDSTYQEDAADWYERYGNGSVGGCSAVRKGNRIGRNYDWKYNHAAEFVVRITPASGRHGSVGVASLGGELTEKMVMSGEYRELYRVLPGMTLDGINDAGVVAEINVIPRDAQKDPAASETRTLHPLAVVRYVLDNFKTAAEAAAYIAAHYYIPDGSENAYHWSISDKTASYVVEDGDFQECPDEIPVLTNHRVMSSDEFGSGYSRDLILAGAGTVEEVIDAAKFTGAYADGWPRPDEFAGVEDDQGRIPHDADERLRAWADEHVTRHLDPETRKPAERDGLLWQSVHSSVYDLDAKTLAVAVQEDFGKRFVFMAAAEGVKLDQSMPTEEPTTENGHGATVKAIWSWVMGLLSNLTIPWGRVTNVPQTFPPSSHNHTAGEVSGLATVATSGSYNDLQNKPAIPTVPTNVSAFTNDAGYIAANGAITVVKLTNANETMADILARIGSEAAAGRYPVFDTHTISDLKLCSISIDAAAGAVRLQDSVTGKIYVGPYSATEKIGQVLAKAVEEYVPITVTAATKDGVTVMGKTVYLHEGADATGRVVETAQYNGEPVTFKVGGGFRYFVRIDDLAGHFPPTTAAGVANAPVSVTLTYGDADHVTTFEEVKMAIDLIGDIATLKAKLIGGDKQINDTWTDLDATGDGDATPAHDADGHPIWNDPMVCTNVEMVEDADGVQHIAAIYMRKYATVNKIPFDAPNQEEATEETAQEGITYYGLTKGATSPSTSNVTVLTLAAGDAIPYATYEKVFKNAYNDSTKNIIVNGHNRYQTSAYRQYLCADKSVGAGLWWSRQHVGQVHPGADYMLHPYQAGCSAALLAAIKPVKRTVAANTKIDGGGTYQVCDPFWLPAHVEMFGNTDTTEGSTQEEYWHAVSGDPSKQPGTSAWNPRKQYDVKDKTTAVTVRLRSARVSTSYDVYYVYASGTINGTGYTARTACASVPACAIY